MSNPDTLIPLNTRPEDERRTIQSKGGKASVRARLKKKAGKELVRAILAMKVTDPQILDEIRKEGVVADSDMTKEVAMHVRQIQKAIRKADTKAYSAVMKAAGYTEDDGVNINIATEEPPVIVFGDTSRPEND
jgi:N-acetylglucosamine kinase-like BadF-type ATPase